MTRVIETKEDEIDELTRSRREGAQRENGCRERLERRREREKKKIKHR